jgi:hypothetical protein
MATLQELEGWLEYFRAYDFGGKVAATAEIIAVRDSLNISQIDFDRVLTLVSNCREGSAICSIWFAVRAWGESRGFNAPSETDLPW